MKRIDINQKNVHSTWSFGLYLFRRKGDGCPVSCQVCIEAEANSLEWYVKNAVQSLKNT